MTTGHRTTIKGKLYDPKTGKFKPKPPPNVAARMKQKTSKRVTVVRRTP